MGHRDHRVHFDPANIKDDFDSDSGVTYQRSGDTIIINLGFLQVNHRYMIELNLPQDVFVNPHELARKDVVPDISTVPNLNCRIAEVTGFTADTPNVYQMKIEFFAYKEKLLREMLQILNPNNREELLKMLLSARVLGKGKGTPILRNGIHCIGVEEGDNDSDGSELGSLSKRT